MTLDGLRKDVEFLKLRYRLDEKGKSEGRLILRYAFPSPSCTILNSDSNPFPHPHIHAFPSHTHPILHNTSNEQASSVFTTSFIQQMLQEEGAPLFDSRSASLGHTLQGGIPSPMDRARAVRLSLKCMAFLERHHLSLLAQTPNEADGVSSSSGSDFGGGSGGGGGSSAGSAAALKRKAPHDSACLITIERSAVQFAPVREVVARADMKNRRGKGTWWEELKPMVSMLGGRTALGD